MRLNTKFQKYCSRLSKLDSLFLLCYQYFFFSAFFFSAVTLLVGELEGHLACNKTGRCVVVGGDNLSGNLEWRDSITDEPRSTWKMAVKMERLVIRILLFRYCNFNLMLTIQCSQSPKPTRLCPSSMSMCRRPFHPAYILARPI